MATDYLETVLSVLETNWNNSNTDSITPDFFRSDERKTIGGLTSNKTQVSVYDPSNETENPISLGYNYVDRIQPVSIDLRTTHSRSHAVNAVEEIKRIIHLKRKTATGWDIMKWNGGRFVENYPGYWHYVVEIQLIKYGELLT
ncbi:MAG: hypothetical protein AB1467_06800 [Candidatus Diapherotrites archaeon]